MRVPQVSERLKEVPAQALRGVFAGIGQLLLITDKLRNKAPAGTDVSRTRAPEPAQTAPQETVADTAADSVPAAREAPEPVGTEALETTGAPETTRAPKATGAPKATKAPRATRAPKATKASEATTASETSQAQQGSETAKAPKTPTVPKARDFDKTGNVRLLGGEDAAAHAARRTARPGKAAGTSKAAEASSTAETSPAAEADAPAESSRGAEASATAGTSKAAEASATAGTSKAADTDLAAEASPVAEAAEEPGDGGPPLPNYDGLTVPSLRARLRNLDIGQVRQVLEYERAHAARPEVITMFERRIAKLAAEA
jgi:hypothetical protein